MWFKNFHTVSSNKSLSAFLLRFTALCLIPGLHFSLSPVGFCWSVVSDSPADISMRYLLNHTDDIKSVVLVQEQVQFMNLIKPVTDNSQQ